MTTQASERLSYSISELCDLSGAGRKSVYAAIRRGDLKTVRLSSDGRKLLVTAESARRWLTPKAEPESLEA